MSAYFFEIQWFFFHIKQKFSQGKRCLPLQKTFSKKGRNDFDLYFQATHQKLEYCNKIQFSQEKIRFQDTITVLPPFFCRGKYSVLE